MTTPIALVTQAGEVNRTWYCLYAKPSADGCGHFSNYHSSCCYRPYLQNRSGGAEFRQASAAFGFTGSYGSVQETPHRGIYDPLCI